MGLIETIAVAQIIAGAGIMLFSIRLAIRLLKTVSPGARQKWMLATSLMVFFLLGYMLTASIVALQVSLPFELVTGLVFLGGALFVLLLMKITAQSIAEGDERAKRLLELNNELAREIESKVKIQDALQATERHLRSSVDSTEDSIYLVDKDYKYLFVNEKHVARLGLRRDKILGKPYGDFHSQEETQEFKAIIDSVLQSGKSTQHNHKSLRDNAYFLRTISPVMDEDGLVVAASVISKNVAELKRIEKELRYLSFNDELTGLYNRRGFITLADQYYKIAKREGKQVTIFYVDMDDLKKINDAHGHNAGDKALVHAGDILKKTFRESDIIARIGGDEFAVFIIEDQDMTEERLSRLQSNLDDFNQSHGLSYTLSFTFGIAHCKAEIESSVEELLDMADKSMYERKKQAIQ